MNLKYTFSLFAIAIAPAFATTITFGTAGTAGFTGGGVNSVSVNNAAGLSGLTVTVTAGVLSPDTCSSQCWLTVDAPGYGVDNSAPAGGASDGSMDLDGSGLHDIITLVFSRNVTLTGATFGNFGGTDDGSLYNTTSGATLVSNFSTSSITGLSSLGTSFRFQTQGTNDSYRLLTVSFNDSGAAVPEPATMGLTGLGLLGLALCKRKRLGVGRVQ
ncbi:MAG: PEP-CTERM sorting domain-containing protein [Bryobacteraceae bacterium]